MNLATRGPICVDRFRKIEGPLCARRVLKEITHIGQLTALVERYFDCQIRTLRCLIGSLNYRKDVRDWRETGVGYTI